MVCFKLDISFGGILSPWTSAYRRLGKGLPRFFDFHLPFICFLIHLYKGDVEILNVYI